MKECSIALLLISLVVCVSSGPTVSTKYGQIEGFYTQIRDGGEAEVFLGIPYAKPPLGELRFEKPVPPDVWDDVYQATSFRNDCVPHSKDATGWSTKVGEDCLHLNIVRPKKTNKLLPVLLWIHGGGYEVGSASMHGYQAFADNYIPHGVIVVSIQYRLGFLGFFTDGTSDAPGNIGLFDQAAALKFVYDNIEAFGGNRDEITVWGYSAGAASASQYTLSPYTRDYVSRAVIMSGSSKCNWVTGYTVPEHSRQLAKAIGCDVKNPKECLKGKSIDELFAAVDEIGQTTDNIDIIKWGPIIDGDYLPAHPDELIKTAPKIPTVFGLDAKECNFFTVLRQLPFVHSFGLFPEEVQKIDEKYVRDVIKNKYLYGNRFGANQQVVYEKLVDFYLNRGRPDKIKGNGFFVDRYTQLFSDASFVVPVLRELTAKLQVDTPIWAYKFDHYNEAIFGDHVPVEVRGSPHTNEYHYLFEMPLLAEFDMTTGDEKIVRDNIVQIVVSFAKTGIPKIGNVAWPQVCDPNDIEYLRVAKNVTVETGLFTESLEFWNELSKFGFDIVDPTSNVDPVRDEL